MERFANLIIEFHALYLKFTEIVLKLFHYFNAVIE